MERRRLGSTGSSVGVVGLGTATWGRGTDPVDARDQVAMLLEAGGCLIDIDATLTDAGIVRDVMADPGLRRDAFVCVRLPVRGSQRDLLAALDDSIASLGVGHADMWTVEGWHQGLPWSEVVSALAVASSTGRARYVGACPAEAWQGALIGAGLATHPQRVPLTAMAMPYSLLDRTDARALSPVCEALDAGILAARPLAGGVLSGKYRHATPPDSRGAGERFGERIHHYRGTWARPVVEGLCAAAEGLGVAPASLAISWTLAQPLVTGCLVGARTLHQWKIALAGSDFALPAEIRSALDEVSDASAQCVHHGMDVASTD